MAIKFNDTGYYQFEGDGLSGLALPDSDWAISMWMRLPDGLPAGSEDVQFFFCSDISGGNPNNLNLWLGHVDSSFPRQMMMRLQGASGTEINQAVVTNIGDSGGVVTADTLLVIQRRGSNIEIYWVEKGSTGFSTTSSIASNNTTITPDFWDIGRTANFPDYWRYRQVLSEFSAVTTQSFSQAEVEELAAGVPVTEVATPAVYFRFLSLNDPEPDVGTLGNDADQVNGGGLTVVTHPFDENVLVDYLGEGEIELGGDADVAFYEGILVDYTGVGEIDFSGAAIVQEFNPASVLVEYTGEGEVLLTGEATTEIVNTLLLVEFEGSGGLGFSGSADSFTPPMITGSGGMILTGSARITNAPGNPYLPNDRWTNNVSLQSEFLYGRLLHQKKNFGSRDSIVYIEGTPQAEVTPVLYNCLYDSNSGEVRLYVAGATTYDVLFIEPELVKLDLTFDVNGRPVVVYQVGTEVWLHQYDTDIADYTEFKISDGTQPFVCWDERREEYVTTGDILVVYKKDTSIYMRKSRDDFELEYATSVLNRATADFTIQGFGMTVTHRMQIRVLITKVLED